MTKIIIKLIVIVGIMTITNKFNVYGNRCTTSLMRLHVKDACENFYSKRSTDETNRYVYNVGNDDDNEEEADYIRPPRSSTHHNRKSLIIRKSIFPEGGYLRVDYPYTKNYHINRRIHSIHNHHHHSHDDTNNLDVNTNEQIYNRKKRFANNKHKRGKRNAHSNISYCCERSDNDDVCGVHLCPISVE